MKSQQDTQWFLGKDGKSTIKRKQQQPKHTPKDGPQIPRPDLRFVEKKANQTKQQTKQKRGKSPTKTPTHEDLPLDTVVYTTVSKKSCFKTNCHSSNVRNALLDEP